MSRAALYHPTMILKSFVLLIGCNNCLVQASWKEQTTLHNKHLKMGVVPAPPMSVISKDENGNDIIGGLLGKFFEYLKKARNCTFKVVIPEDHLWGHCYGLNNCTGMIGQVYRNEVDLALGIVDH